jgi:hypothetical protein
MPCDHLKAPGGIGAIVCARGHAPRSKRCCACYLQGTYMCDWKIAPEKTCDKPICPEHAEEVATDKHLCPQHQEAYRQWCAQREKTA